MPTLFNAIPAIEVLHNSWFSQADRIKYAPFKVALHAVMNKLNKYYKKTADSDAHILAMHMSSLMGFVHVFANIIACSATPWA